jgi:hypothetical protein
LHATYFVGAVPSVAQFGKKYSTKDAVTNIAADWEQTRVKSLASAWKNL